MAHPRMLRGLENSGTEFHSVGPHTQNSVKIVVMIFQPKQAKSRKLRIYKMMDLSFHEASTEGEDEFTNPRKKWRKNKCFKNFPSACPHIPDR